MRVTIRTDDILKVVPELVPEFRRLGEDLPETINVEGAWSVEAETDKKFREQYPEHWIMLTTIEWIIFTHMHKPDGGYRESLRVVMRSGVLGVSDDGDWRTSNVVDVHVKNLRRKLRTVLGNKHHIISKRKWGYILVEGPEPAGNLPLRYRSDFSAADDQVKAPRPKQIGADGAVVLPTWRKQRGVLNAVEFGYMKEMVMDDMTKGDIAFKLDIHGEDLDRAFNAPNYDAYITSLPGKLKRPRRQGVRHCRSCGQTGHYTQTCALKQEAVLT